MFYQDHVRSHQDREYEKGLDDETIDMIKKYYYANIKGGRHPLVPKGDVLVKIGQISENDRDVFYFIPESLIEAYSKEVEI